MQKNIKKQKIMYYLFLVVTFVAFIFSLSFMTDFSNLFGLKTKQNAAVAEFHDVTLQTYVKTMFYCATIGILTFVVSLLLEIKTKVVDKFALILMGVGILFIIASSVYGIVNIIELKEIYLSLDFSYISNEGGSHTVETRTFSFGTIFYIVQILFVSGYFAVLAQNHFKFLKLLGGAE